MSTNTRNNGQWSEGRFRGFVTSALRAAVRRWPPKYEALKKAFVGSKINAKSGRKAKHFLCAGCDKEYVQANVQVDHKIPIGSCKTWDEFVEKLFCEADNLQVLCLKCHKIKTKKERSK